MKSMYMETGDLLIKFPILPEEIKIKSSSNNETFEVVKFGEINVLKDRKLREFSFTSFLPAKYDLYPFLNVTEDEFIEAGTLVNEIGKVRESKKPFRFILDGSIINMLCSIEDFTYGYVYGDDDVHFELSFKEYRDISVKELFIDNGAKGTTAEFNEREEPVLKEITVGCDVKVSGTPHRDSFGNGPGTTLNDFEGKLNFVKTDNRSHPFHVTDKEGNYKGWVTPESVEVL